MARPRAGVCRVGREKCESAVRALSVVVGAVDAQDGLEVAAADDQQPIEALGADGSDEALGVSVRLWRADRVWMTLMPSLRKTSSNSAANLLSWSWIRKRIPFEEAGEAEIARLLCHPSTGRIGGAARQADAAALELDEEEHAEAAQRQRHDGEEGAGPRPWPSRMRLTVLGETVRPSLRASPAIRG